MSILSCLLSSDFNEIKLFLLNNKVGFLTNLCKFFDFWSFILLLVFGDDIFILFGLFWKFKRL